MTPAFPFIPDTQYLTTPINGECCSGDNNCVCVTSGDVDNWNSAYDIIQANSANWGNQHDYSGEISAISAMLKPDLWNSAYSMLADSADIWNSAYAIASEISGKYLSSVNVKYYNDGDLGCFGLSGIGTKEDPIRLNSETEYNLELYFKLFKDLYTDTHHIETRNWVESAYGEYLYTLASGNLEYMGQIAQSLNKLWLIVQGISCSGSTYIPGQYIQIKDQTISVTGLSAYFAGDGIKIENNTIINTNAYSYESAMNYSNYTNYSGDSIYYNEK